MTKENEQWKSEGNCSGCRRKSYCSKECTASKKARERMIYDAIGRATGIPLLRQVIRGRSFKW